MNFDDAFVTLIRGIIMVAASFYVAGVTRLQRRCFSAVRGPTSASANRPVRPRLRPLTNRCTSTYTPICIGNSMSTVRWNVAVSSDTDQSLRVFLANHGGGRKGDLSRFIEEAVRAHILEITAEQVKATNAHLSENDSTALIDEAVQWARNH